MQNKAILVVAVYVASLVLVALGHCAPNFGFASVIAQAEHSSDDNHDDHEHNHDHDHDQGGSAEECAADLMAKGCVSIRSGVAKASAAKPIAVLPSIQAWSKGILLVTRPPERPPDTVPRAHTRYAQILARTGRLIV